MAGGQIPISDPSFLRDEPIFALSDPMLRVLTISASTGIDEEFPYNLRGSHVRLGQVEVIYDEVGLRINLDLRHFLIEDVIVKIITDIPNNAFIVRVDCSHRQRDDENGFYERCFSRKLSFSQELYDKSKAEASWSSRRMLTITVPLKRGAQHAPPPPPPNRPFNQNNQSQNAELPKKPYKNGHASTSKERY